MGGFEPVLPPRPIPAMRLPKKKEQAPKRERDIHVDEGGWACREAMP